MPILSRNVDQKSIETVFLIAICRPTSDKWQSKTLLLSIFDPRLSIVDYIFDCRLPGVRTPLHVFMCKSAFGSNIEGQKNPYRINLIWVHIVFIAQNDKTGPMDLSLPFSCNTQNMVSALSPAYVLWLPRLYCKKYEPWSDCSLWAVWSGFIVFACTVNIFWSVHSRIYLPCKQTLWSNLISVQTGCSIDGEYTLQTEKSDSMFRTKIVVG